MALDYRKCAEEIVANIGGAGNVVSAAHCATRLRLVIADNAKVNKAVLENIDGVKGMFESNGQLQLIIGTGTVNKVYDEFLAVTGLTAASKADVKAAAAAKGSPVETDPEGPGRCIRSHPSGDRSFRSDDGSCRSHPEVLAGLRSERLVLFP